jgi:hypothetical protein
MPFYSEFGQEHRLSSGWRVIWTEHMYEMATTSTWMTFE